MVGQIRGTEGRSVWGGGNRKQMGGGAGPSLALGGGPRIQRLRVGGSPGGGAVKGVGKTRVGMQEGWSDKGTVGEGVFVTMRLLSSNKSKAVCCSREGGKGGFAVESCRRTRRGRGGRNAGC